jgi:succinyl-diaminopimelate desuccinylase
VPDPIALAAQLVALDTAGRNEDQALDLIEPLCAAAGLSVERIPWRPGRSNLVARWRGGGDLVLAGHVDTVPYDGQRWSRPPLGGDVVDGNLVGRGAADMKGAVGAMVAAACAAAEAEVRPFTLVMTAGEETGCQGAAALRDARVLPADPILIVGEATGNRILLGHKGAVWLKVAATGHAAHGSAPELGVNAIELLARAMQSLKALPASRHPHLGRSTVSVGAISGGSQVNLVPDLAEMLVDVRVVQVDDAARAAQAIEQATGSGSVQRFLELPSVWTDPASDLTRRVFDIAAVAGQPLEPQAAAYFTDASVLADPMNPRVYLFGPGDPAAPHTADESCSVDAITLARDVYLALLVRLER